MTGPLTFSIRATTKRKRQTRETYTSRPSVHARATLDGVFVTAEDAAQEALEAAERDEQRSRPQKMKTMLLEDEQAKVQRLQTEGNTLAEAGRFRAAMDRWHEAIAIDPSNAVIYELLAQAAMAAGEDFNAVQFGLNAVRLSPSWGDAYHTLARCHLNFGELELAIENLNKAEELMGANEELTSDRHEIQKLLVEQRQILERRETEAKGVVDEEKLQVISCMKYLSLRGRVG